MLKTSCTILTSFNFKLDLPAVWFQLFDCFQQSETIFFAYSKRGLWHLWHTITTPTFFAVSTVGGKRMLGAWFVRAITTDGKYFSAGSNPNPSLHLSVPLSSYENGSRYLSIILSVPQMGEWKWQLIDENLTTWKKSVPAVQRASKNL